MATVTTQPKWRPGLKMLQILMLCIKRRFRKSTVNRLRVFENWCDENALHKGPEKLPPEQLDKVLERFYTSVRNQDRTNYEPGSLKVMQAALDHHLKEKGYSLSIIEDREF